VVNLVAKMMNLPAVFPPSDDPGRGGWADLTRIRKHTGWEPQFSLEDGVRGALEAWRAAG
jgi:nucleoside-diphosphate-sugar epimerase